MEISTTIIIIVAIVAIVVIAAISLALKSSKKPTKRGQQQNQYFYQKKSFFSRNELSFYRELEKAIAGASLIIFAKPRLADVIEPKKGTKNWNASFTKIRSKHLDFVLCDSSAVKPVLAIELDDGSHDRPDRRQRDQFVDLALKQAGIPILHVKSSTGIREKIKSAMSDGI